MFGLEQRLNHSWKTTELPVCFRDMYYTEIVVIMGEATSMRPLLLLNSTNVRIWDPVRPPGPNSSVKIQACMNEGAGVCRPRYRHKSHAKCDVDAGIVGDWRFVIGKVEFALLVIIPHLNTGSSNKMSKATLLFDWTDKEQLQSLMT